MRILLTLSLLVLFTQVFSKPINQSQASNNAIAFLNNGVQNSSLKSTINNLSLVKKNARILQKRNKQTKALINDTITYYYAFNKANNKGFILVSGDDRIIPVLGYSDEGAIDMNNLPPNFEAWLKQYEMQIDSLVMNEAYDYLLPYSSTENPINTDSIAPLLTTKWDQNKYYNDLCPIDAKASGTGNNRVYAGCVATAMAQIMKYWNYPNTGIGSHSYTHYAYGLQSANFGNTVYNWASMPNQANSANASIATLMYHCGVSVDMDYGINGSGANISSEYYTGYPIGIKTADSAFINYFNYNKGLRHLFKIDYNDKHWIGILKNELKKKRPIYYGGSGTLVGHAFVCDGYDKRNYFHFNWGWSGKSDGYFTINQLNPSSSFNYKQVILIGIDTVQKYFEIDTTTIYVGSSSSQRNFNIFSNSKWKVTKSDSWLSLSDTVGIGNKTVNINIAANTSLAVRKGKLTFTNENNQKYDLSIVQLDSSLIFEVSQDSIFFSANGETKTLNIHSNLKWSLALVEPYFIISKTNGSGDGSINIQCPLNKNYREIGSLLSIVNDEYNLSKTIKLYQDFQFSKLNLCFNKLRNSSDTLIITNKPNVLSNQTITINDSIYVSFGLAIKGEVEMYKSVRINFYIDNMLKISILDSKLLASNVIRYIKNVNLGKRSVGKHSVIVKLDYDDYVFEYNEFDNSYIKYFEVIKNPNYIVSEQIRTTISPIPNNGSFNIFIENSEIESIEVINIIGNIVYSKKSIHSDKYFLESGLKTGIYTVVIRHSKGVEVRRISIIK